MNSRLLSRFVPCLGALTLSASILLFPIASHAAPGGEKTYRVTIENLTPDNGGGAAQVLSPALVVAHSNKISLFHVGETASPGVADVAEDAITATGVAMLSGNPDVGFVGGLGAPILPGSSGSFEFTTSGNANRLSLVTMLVNTNDAFTGLDGVQLTGNTNTYMAMAYDAGSEVNDQLTAHIPGPPCCGDVGQNGTVENGVITHHAGILAGVGDLDPARWGWDANRPVARITVERVR